MRKVDDVIFIWFGYKLKLRRLERIATRGLVILAILGTIGFCVTLFADRFMDAIFYLYFTLMPLVSICYIAIKSLVRENKELRKEGVIIVQ